MNSRTIGLTLALLVSFAMLPACETDESSTALVILANDFDNEEMAYQPPWTICEAAYMGVEFGEIPLGTESAEEEVPAGLDYVLMVAAWDDPECNPENCLPIASKNEEETVSGQQRTIYINMPNHQGPCPPEGVQPIPQETYERILELWPAYGFKPYDERTENTECASE